MTAHPINQTGVFTITTGAAGAPTLKAVLSITANSGIVAGHGTLTQAVNPPVNAQVHFQGVVHRTGLGDQNLEIFALTGTPVPNLPGATNIPHLVIQLPSPSATSGSAQYTVWKDSPQLQEVSAPVTVQWLLQE